MSKLIKNRPTVEEFVEITKYMTPFEREAAVGELTALFKDCAENQDHKYPEALGSLSYFFSHLLNMYHQKK